MNEQDGKDRTTEEYKQDEEDAQQKRTGGAKEKVLNDEETRQATRDNQGARR